jgi:hypothetical protein
MRTHIQNRDRCRRDQHGDKNRAIGHQSSSTTDARNAFVPTITMDMEIRHATWQRAMLFLGVLLLLGGTVLNVYITEPKDKGLPNIFQRAKSFQVFTLMIAIGATLTTWLGKDFWASVFRNDIWLWRGMAFLGRYWRRIIGIAMVFIGVEIRFASKLSWLKEVLHEALLCVSSSIRSVLGKHKFWIAWALIGGGVILIAWNKFSLERAKGEDVWKK